MGKKKLCSKYNFNENDGRSNTSKTIKAIDFRYLYAIPYYYPLANYIRFTIHFTAFFHSDLFFSQTPSSGNVLSVTVIGVGNRIS